MKEIISTGMLKALSPKGKQRVLVLVGEDHNKNYQLLEYLGDSITEVHPNSFCVLIDAEKIGSPQDWCSQFARNLRANSDLKEPEIFNFALNIGSTLGSVKKIDDIGSSTGEKSRNLAEKLVEYFDQLLEKRIESKNAPHIILGLSGLDKTTEPMRQWLVNDLNQALRKSENFKKSRFLFSVEKEDDSIDVFLNQFGFEKVHYKNIDSEPKNILPNSNSSQLLKKDMSISPEIDLFDNFSDAELEYLKLCAYPHRISKYTLGHFASDRDAALAYNWLSRQKKLFTLHQSGDLLLGEQYKATIRSWHAESIPEEAEKWSIKASILDAFHELFPDDDTHWIPLNLQLFNSFNHKMIRQLFVGDQIDEVIKFVEQNPHLFTEEDDNLSLIDDDKMVIRNYMEISERTHFHELDNSIRELWLKDIENYNSKKLKLEEEKHNIITEIEDTIKQVANIEDIKDGLIENFRNPKKNRQEKVYSFTSSAVLIAIGIVTIGASLLTDGIGAYHAACGIALTAFGFFWPNVEIKRAAFAGNATNSNLAIETQQRSLNHRASSLNNRMQLMKGNLDAVESNLNKLGHTPPKLYLDTEGNDSNH